MFRGITVLIAVTSLAAASPAQTGPTLYRLEPSSSFEEGCQPPCQCPLAITNDLFGTFTLRFTSADPAGYVHYAIQAVNLEIDLAGAQRRVTGSGEYIVGGQLVIRQRLQLDLSFNGTPPQHFDSGLVVGGGAFPILDIAVARNGFTCWDQVFALKASPVPDSELVPFGLVDSLYEEGCLPPCVCPMLTRRAAGSFQLLDLGSGSNPALQHYALIDIDWQTLPPSLQGHKFTGFGIYSLDTGMAKQRLVCDLTDIDGHTERFDSGAVPGGFHAPARFDVDVALNGFACYDHVFRLQALP